jgi:alkylation response protein AidB-like acyl-CoA dehydrogenase
MEYKLARALYSQSCGYIPRIALLEQSTLKLRNSFSPQIQISRNPRELYGTIAKMCLKFLDQYWLWTDETKKFPIEFHSVLAKYGWLGICMPSEYGGHELGISEAAIMMQTISESGGGMTGASAAHMNIFSLEPVVKFGTGEQKKRFLVPLVKGEERACFGVTEPNTGLDTLRLQSSATRDGD